MQITLASFPRQFRIIAVVSNAQIHTCRDRNTAVIMAGTYKNYMKLLELWPLDKSKPGRDLGQHIRDQVKVAFAKGEANNTLNRALCDRYYMSLKRITSNHYGQMYVRNHVSSASGLTKEQCNLALSPELLEYLKEGDKNFISRTLLRITARYNASKVKKQHDTKSQRNSRSFRQATNEKVENEPHVPVMAKEVLQYLEPSPGKTFIDMTFGAGGHSTMILESSPDVKIFALDRDPIAHEFAHKLSEKYPGRVIPLLGKFSELPELLCKHKVEKYSIDGFLFDFGCSSMQFDIAERGFALSKNGPLDMRMDGFRCPGQPTAADVLERATEIDLSQILRIYGEEKKAKKIARAIVDARYTFRSLETTEELAQLVDSVVHDRRLDMLGRSVHSATKTFQALRIFVNNELNEINYGIILAGSYLRINGRLITITFHSLEDTIIKRHISGNIMDSIPNRDALRYVDRSKSYDANEIKYSLNTPWKMLHKHVITPAFEEVKKNPRSRSAKLRAISKVT